MSWGKKAEKRVVYNTPPPLLLLVYSLYKKKISERDCIFIYLYVISELYSTFSISLDLVLSSES